MTAITVELNIRRALTAVSDSQRELDRALGLEELVRSPLGPLALELARACSSENGPQLNALRMLPILRAFKQAA